MLIIIFVVLLIVTNFSLCFYLKNKNDKEMVNLIMLHKQIQDELVKKHKEETDTLNTNHLHERSLLKKTIDEYVEKIEQYEEAIERSQKAIEIALGYESFYEKTLTEMEEIIATLDDFLSKRELLSIDPDIQNLSKLIYIAHDIIIGYVNAKIGDESKKNNEEDKETDKQE